MRVPRQGRTHPRKPTATSRPRSCSPPLYERKLKTTAWYYGPSSNVDLFPPTADALNQWNVANQERGAPRHEIAEAERGGAQINFKVFGTDAAKAADVLANLDDETRSRPTRRAQAEHRGSSAIPDVFVLYNPTIDSDSNMRMKKPMAR
ncbi:MAG: hypothetical protein U0235_11775 [Polyangiaceae bacterium]